MKSKIRKIRKYEAIKALIEKRDLGLQPEHIGRKNLKMVSIPVEDRQDYMMRLSALLEVCVFALDGDGSFYSKSHAHLSKELSVTLVLEMALGLMPYDQMACMDKISEIIKQDEKPPISTSFKNQL